MRTTIVETTITTYPHNVEVPVTIEFADYSDMECMHGHQYIVMHVGNPLQPIKEMTFNPIIILAGASAVNAEVITECSVVAIPYCLDIPLRRLSCTLR